MSAVAATVPALPAALPLPLRKRRPSSTWCWPRLAPTRWLVIKTVKEVTSLGLKEPRTWWTTPQDPEGGCLKADAEEMKEEAGRSRRQDRAEIKFFAPLSICKAAAQNGRQPFCTRGGSRGAGFDIRGVQG